MEALQGVDNTYFVGEVVSGGWILNVWDHMTYTFPSFYTDYQALAASSDSSDSGDSDATSSDSSSDAKDTALIVLTVAAVVCACVSLVLCIVYRQKVAKLE